MVDPTFESSWETGLVRCKSTSQWACVTLRPLETDGLRPPDPFLVELRGVKSFVPYHVDSFQGILFIQTDEMGCLITSSKYDAWCSSPIDLR